MTKRMADIFRAKIRATRESARSLAVLMGVKQQTLSQFLRGKDIRLDTAQKIADYFKMTLK